MTKIISINSSKGGVGKSTMAAYLSLMLARLTKKRVLIIDFCPNSSIASEFGKDRKHLTFTTFDWYTRACPDEKVILPFGNTNVFYIPSSEKVEDIVTWTTEKFRTRREERLKDRLQPYIQNNIFEYILIDNHPNERDDKNVFSMVAADHIIFTVDISPKSKEATDRDLEIFKIIQAEYPEKDFSLAPTKVDLTKESKSLDLMKKHYNDLGVTNKKFLPAIRYSKNIKTNQLFAILKEKKLENKYIQNVLNDYSKLAKEVIQRV